MIAATGPAAHRLDKFERLLERCLGEADTDGACAILLEGSIAEGFGNNTSDIDFILLQDALEDLPSMPTILFIAGQRVELRSRSLSAMRMMLLKVAGQPRSGRRELLRLDETLLDRCQRFLHARVLRDDGSADALRSLLPETQLRDVTGRWFAAHAQESMRTAVALGELGQWPEAASWARSALTLGAKSWLAGLGETYLAKKWVSRQIMRTAPDSELGQRFLHLENPTRADLADAAYVEQVGAFLRDVGIRNCQAGAGRAVLKRCPGVTTWQIGSRVHILRDGRDVFALSRAAAQVWRSLVFRRSLPSLDSMMSGSRVAAGRIIAELHRLGLVALAWRGSGTVLARRTSSIAPDSQRPTLSVDGMVFPDEEVPIRLAAIPAARFAAAGMSLVFANLVIENAREDALGALAAQQWRVMERACRAMLRHACMAVLSAQGAHPLPPVEELHTSLAANGNIPPELLARIQNLDRDILVEDEAAARLLLNRLDVLVRDIRDTTGASLFPRCFTTAGEWQQAIDIGYDWIILGAHVKADFPLDEARDVIATGGRQPLMGKASLPASR